MTSQYRPVMSRGFVIVHGWQNRRPEGHWHRWLTGELRARGELVSYAQYPSPDEPVLDDWLELLMPNCDCWARRGAGDRRAQPRRDHHPARGARVEEPFAARYCSSRRQVVGSPRRSRRWPRSRSRRSRGNALPPRRRTQTRMVCSDNDPFSRIGADVEFGTPLAFDTEVLPGRGHLSMDDGYGPWPAALDWCLDPTTRFALAPARLA